jgi:hypothetical protein
MRSLGDEAQKAACPIYGIRGYVGGPIESGFLLCSRSTVLITAAHVFYRRHHLPLYIPVTATEEALGPDPTLILPVALRTRKLTCGCRGIKSGRCK